MPVDDRVVSVAREWIEKAENDLKNATHTLELGEECPTDTVCFHAQQCVEKYVKALLTVKERPFPRTHDLGALLSHVPEEARPVLTADEQDRLTEYATVTRYPGDYDPIPLREAREAVKLARRVRKDVRSRLPKGALRPTGR